MKAYEARELTKGSIKKKRIFFRARLAWLCGRLNYKIENNAELGQYKASLNKLNQRAAKLYYPLMAQYYERDGFFVCYQTEYYYYNEFTVFWDINSIPKHFNNYDYHTKENEYESNCTSSRDR